MLGVDVARYALLSKPKLLPFNGQLSLQAKNDGTRLSLRVMHSLALMCYPHLLFPLTGPSVPILATFKVFLLLFLLLGFVGSGDFAILLLMQSQNSL